MTYLIAKVAHAGIEELRQKHELHYRLSEIKKDPRLLEDVGLTFAEISNALKEDQRVASPLRRLMRQHAGAIRREADRRRDG